MSKQGKTSKGSSLFTMLEVCLMTELIAAGFVFLSPIAWKIIQLRVFQYDRGFVHMEFGKPLKISREPLNKSVTKRARKQIT